MLADSQRRAAAMLLRAAEVGREPIDPLVDLFPELDVVDAYSIALENIQRRVDAGDEVYGHKVGLSSEVMQQMMGVDEPDYGHLLNSMVYTEGTPIDSAAFCYPRIEVEIGFVLGDDLPGEACTEADVLTATDHVVPCIELIDSRIRDWRIAIADTIADNASSAGVIVGGGRVATGAVDIGAIEAVLFEDDSEIARGEASAVLGNPTIPVAWLARTVARFGVRLKAGQLVLPGSCTRAIDVLPGRTYRAEFSDIGSVTACFK